ncbi:MAG: hypothetical protein V3V20_07320, partial [Algisphaera sp.]
MDLSQNTELVSPPTHVLDPEETLRAARETARDAELVDVTLAEVPESRLALEAWGVWAIILLGGMLIFVLPIVLALWVTAGWAWPVVRLLSCGAVMVPAFFVAIVWWLAVSVSLGTKCPACGDVLHAEELESVTPVPNGRRRCANCLAGVIG